MIYDVPVESCTLCHCINLTFFVESKWLLGKWRHPLWLTFALFLRRLATSVIGESFKCNLMSDNLLATRIIRQHAIRGITVRVRSSSTPAPVADNSIILFMVKSSEVLPRRVDTLMEPCLFTALYKACLK